MKEEELTKLMEAYWIGDDNNNVPLAFEDGFRAAFRVILAKREEFGHGYLKGKLLDWMLELDIS